ncbi:MAG TPA: diacylglycerol kinase family protein [Brevefilum sp.]
MPVKAYVVLNPVAGQSDPYEIRAVFNRAHEKGLWDFDLYETTGEEDLKAVVLNALEENYDLVVACGGDGTVSGVADGMADSEVPLGVLPGGTVNAFATEMGIPGNIEDALEIILGDHQLRSIDAIESDGRYYLLFCSIGLSSESIAAIEREEKDKLGWLAYLSNGIKKSSNIESKKVHLEIDGRTINLQAYEILLFNSDQLGVIDEHLGLDVAIDDGVIDLYVLRSKGLGDLFLSLFYRIISKPEKDPNVRYWRIKESVKIDVDPVMKYQADGDIKGETPVVFRVAKGVLRVISSL